MTDEPSITYAKNCALKHLAERYQCRPVVGLTPVLKRLIRQELDLSGDYSPTNLEHSGRYVIDKLIRDEGREAIGRPW